MENKPPNPRKQKTPWAQHSVHGWLVPLHLAEKGPPAIPEDGLVYWWDISFPTILNLRAH